MGKISMLLFVAFLLLVVGALAWGSVDGFVLLGAAAALAFWGSMKAYDKGW